MSDKFNLDLVNNPPLGNPRNWILREEAEKLWKGTNRRVLTVQIEIVDKKSSEWIWDYHMNSLPFHGVLITGIKEGKMNEDFKYHDGYVEEEGHN